MGKQQLYQGRDWFSESQTAAQLFEALDKLYDLCTYAQKGMIKEPGLFLGTLHTLEDTVLGNLAHLSAELIPKAQYAAPPPQGWQAFELAEQCKELSALIDLLQITENNETISKIMTLTLSIKEHLRVLDQ